MDPSVSIDIDKDTADVLQVRAAELGVTVPQLIAELAALDSTPYDKFPELAARVAGELVARTDVLRERGRGSFRHCR